MPDFQSRSKENLISPLTCVLHNLHVYFNIYILFPQNQISKVSNNNNINETKIISF